MKDTIMGAFKSMTIWFNTLVAAFIFALPELQMALPQMAGYLPIEIYKWLALAVILSNIVLRFKTNEALKHK